METIENLAQRMICRIIRHRSVDGFSNAEVLQILKRSRNIMQPLPAMLELETPITIFGDIHGQLADLLRYFDIIGYPPKHNLLFLGDYIDRGSHSLEVIMLLLCYKIKHPSRIHMLRGNHECFKMNRLYGFHEELRRKRNTYLWKQFQDVFNEFALCASIGRKILCMHGGISEHVKSWQSFYDLRKPSRPKECDQGLALDLMWADPTQDKCTTFSMNTLRSISVMFGEPAVVDFMKMLGLRLIVRAHEVSQEGFNFMFDKRVVTVFSAPFYCGNDSNCGAIMHVNSSYEVSFTVLRPRIIPNADNFELAQQMENNYKALLAPSPDPNRGRHLQQAAQKKAEKSPIMETLSPPNEKA
ncbi:unnamed protein product [Caenorhabditis angaria]|uniref:Serine/threonine-protein phosphatase n=1 Tax=Caenorhabditis angaria TaxID=860376 RepID=A0A9P1IM73_9PELO|nr:unnamed protein product [Caenorhabditis angaria]